MNNKYLALLVSVIFCVAIGSAHAAQSDEPRPTGSGGAVSASKAGARSARASATFTNVSVAEELAVVRDYFQGSATKGLVHATPLLPTKKILSTGKSATPHLTAILVDSREPVGLRCYSAQLLSKGKDVSSVPALAKTAAAPSEAVDVRAASLVALSTFKENNEAQQVLLQAAQAPDQSRLQRIALGALSKVKSSASVDALARSAAAPDLSTRFQAVTSLSDLAADESNPAKEQAVQELQSAAYLVVESLRERKRNKAAADKPELDKAAYAWMRSTVHGVARAQPTDALEILSQVYDLSADDRLRQDTVSVAGGFTGNEKARQLLIRALNDETPKVRMVVGRALLILSQGVDATILKERMQSEANEQVRRDWARGLRQFAK